jgi:hypothetical protein
MEIGLWLHIEHFAAGGPSAVIIGFVIGIKQIIPTSTILINEPGYINFQLFGKDRDVRLYPINTVFSPNPIPLQYVGIEDPNDDLVWRHAMNMTFSSMWVINWLGQKFPIQKAIEDGTKNINLWEAGIDTDYFTPSSTPKTQDFFIYYKSQNMSDIEGIWNFLFHHYYGIKGSLICYHFYTPEMLRDAAQKSKFCIMLDNEETQGLAAIEIMACDCPIFCIDRTFYANGNKAMEGSVTSIVSWSAVCGLKSTKEEWKSDFPTFLANLSSYTPATFAHTNYTYKESARKLMNIALRIMTPVLEMEQS